jgi:hypothetical protein
MGDEQGETAADPEFWANKINGLRFRTGLFLGAASV